MIRVTLAASLCLLPLSATADAPNVAADIAPVHALVAQVMGGVGAPDLLIPATQSPHESNLRPSDAATLQQSNIVFIIGKELTPWLPDRIATLAPDAKVVDLLDYAPMQLSYAEGAHDDHEEEGHDDHEEEGHDDHKDHDAHADHDDHKEHDDHEEHAEHEEHDDHEGHDHDGLDPHAWLDPRNAAAWLAVIADELAALDPDNAQSYQDAAAAQAEMLTSLGADTQQKLDAVKGAGFLSYHDAYAYFAERFGAVSNGSLASNEGAAPSAADMRRAQDLIQSGAVSCVFTEPQYSDKSLTAITEGSAAQVVELDPLGARHTPGPELYAAVINDMADAFETCLTPAS